MKTFLVFLFTLPLAAQAPATAQAPLAAQAPAAAQASKPAGKQEAAKPAEAQPAKPGEAKAEAPSPAVEKWFTGSVDFGFRWVGDVRGDFNTYRSVVNLGQGPKLFGADFTVQPSANRLVDRIDVHANSWGGDPYNTVRLNARREKLYDFTWDYRNIAYFNFLPSFADASRERGFFLNQRAFDTFRRASEFELDLFPGGRIVPYFAYSRNGGRGRGTTNFVLQANEYTVPTRLSDHTNEYRGGFRFEFSRFHLTLEQGAVSFRDGQEVFSGQAPNFGNLTSPFLGQRLFLTTGSQAYRVDGDALFSKALFTANPVSWASVYAQFLYSRPKTKTNFVQNNTGNFFDFSTLAFYSGQTRLLDAQARQPHPSGSFSLELRPLQRLRIMESWMTDRLHDAASALLTDQLLVSGSTVKPAAVFSAERLVLNYNQQEVNLLFDLTSRLTLRGGHRYVWGDASTGASLPLRARGLDRESGELRRHVGLAGLTFRPRQRLSATVDFEASPGDRSYFRTSLQEYQKARIQTRYQPLTSLQLAANFSVLNNQNPAPAIRYDFLSRQNTVSLFWTPGAGKRLSLLAEYGRSTLRSNISYLVPNTLDRELSLYQERGHTGTALVDVPLPTGAVQPKISFGGSFYTSSGTRPARYYQPMGRVSVPFGRHVQWYSEWRWYALTQPFYLFEGFRSHQFITAFRLTM